MTRPGIEPRSPGPLANTLIIRIMERLTRLLHFTLDPYLIMLSVQLVASCTIFESLVRLDLGLNPNLPTIGEHSNWVFIACFIWWFYLFIFGFIFIFEKIQKTKCNKRVDIYLPYFCLSLLANKTTSQIFHVDFIFFFFLDYCWKTIDILIYLIKYTEIMTWMMVHIFSVKTYYGTKSFQVVQPRYRGKFNFNTFPNRSLLAKNFEAHLWKLSVHEFFRMWVACNNLNTQECNQGSNSIG